MSYWTRNFPLHLTSIASLVTVFTSYVSFALLLTLFQLVLQLPLSTLLSQIALTIAYLSILVCHLCDWPALTVFCGTPYWPNTKVQSCIKLHVGGSALAPYLTVYRVQGCFLGVAVPVPVRNCSNLGWWFRIF